jgi:preprotein translocase subunit SecE
MGRLAQKVKTFLEEARAEFRHVNWPTRAEATRLTGVVIFLSLALAVFLGGFDYFFSYALKTFILKS